MHQAPTGTFVSTVFGQSAQHLQRCDRVYPCGLCVSRGVSHLCRWENVPVARPTPARPPVIPSPGSNDSIQQLSARIASLEKTVVAERLRNRSRSDNHHDSLSVSSPHSSSRGLSLPNDYSPGDSVVSLHSPSSANSPYSSPEPYSQEDENERLAAPHLSDNVYHTVSSLAQQSIAHHGEYIGRGSSLSALYSVAIPSRAFLPQAYSCNSRSAPESPLAFTMSHRPNPVRSSSLLLPTTSRVHPFSVSSNRCHPVRPWRPSVRFSSRTRTGDSGSRSNGSSPPARTCGAHCATPSPRSR